MLVYMINELLVEKKIPIDDILSYLESYEGDFCNWYESLNVTSTDWRKSFFRKYLPQTYHPYVRRIFSELGESLILNRIASIIDVDQRTLTSCPEARERALDMLVHDLGYLQKYNGKTPLRDYIYATVRDSFKDKAGIIKNILEQQFNEESEHEEKMDVDPSLLKTTDPLVVHKLFQNMIEVDKIFITSNQPQEYRQYSFLSAYQLWWFRRMTSNLNKNNPNFNFTIHDFNVQPGNREHVFITKMFAEIMPTVELVMGTADLRQLVRKLSSALHGVEGNTGVNIPISFQKLTKGTQQETSRVHGSWHEDALHCTLVDTTKRDKFGLLLDAFIALGRFHNIMESAGVEFPSFYTELSYDSYYVYKFVTLYDYLYHSHKVLSTIHERKLSVHLEGLLRPLNLEKSTGYRQGDTAKFNEFFSLLAHYVKNTLKCPLLIDDYEDERTGRIVKGGYKYFLHNAYEDLANEDDPMQYIIPNYVPKGLSNFAFKQFEKNAEEYFPENIPSAYLTIFYKRAVRQEILPIFIKLYKQIMSVYDYIVKTVGIIQGVTNVTGPPPKLLVTDAEFSIIITEHELFLRLNQLHVDGSLTHEDLIPIIVDVLIHDKIGAQELVCFMMETPSDFANHWEHIKHILLGMFKVARESKGLLFDFDKSERIPPMIPIDKAKRYKMLVELKKTPAQIRSRVARIEKQGYSKNSSGFLKTPHGTYLIHYFGGSAYFAHADGYYINDKLEIRILEES